MRDITQEIDITPTHLERKDARTAQPISECFYPKCEECDKYHGHYCTVPMVVSKQIYLFIGEKLAIMDKRLADVENLVTEEILGVR